MNGDAKVDGEDLLAKERTFVFGSNAYDATSEIGTNADQAYNKGIVGELLVEEGQVSANKLFMKFIKYLVC